MGTVSRMPIPYALAETNAVMAGSERVKKISNRVLLRSAQCPSRKLSVLAENLRMGLSYVPRSYLRDSSVDKMWRLGDPESHFGSKLFKLNFCTRPFFLFFLMFRSTSPPSVFVYARDDPYDL